MTQEIIIGDLVEVCEGPLLNKIGEVVGITSSVIVRINDFGERQIPASYLALYDETMGDYSYAQNITKIYLRDRTNPIEVDCIFDDAVVTFQDYRHDDDWPRFRCVNRDGTIGEMVAFNPSEVVSLKSYE